MALKIRCTKCEKKISIDEAFAGGVCRCPYCKELVVVPGQSSAASSARPDAPASRADAPGRPDAPPPIGDSAAAGQAPELAEAPAGHAHQQHIPMAKPVKVMGLVAVGLAVVLIAAVIAVVVILVKQKDSTQPSAAGPEPTKSGAGATADPFKSPVGKAGKATGPMMVDMPLTAPVLYCLDTSGSMRNVFDSAASMVEQSLGSLKDGKFNILLITEAGETPLDKDWLTYEANKEKVNEFLGEVDVRGSSMFDETLEAAIARKPATLVLLAAKAPGDEAHARIVAKAKESGVKIVCIALHSMDSENNKLKALAESAGGECRDYTPAALQQYIDMQKRK